MRGTSTGRTHRRPDGFFLSQWQESKCLQFLKGRDSFQYTLHVSGCFAWWLISQFKKEDQLESTWDRAAIKVSGWKMKGRGDTELVKETTRTWTLSFKYPRSCHLQAHMGELLQVGRFGHDRGNQFQVLVTTWSLELLSRGSWSLRRRQWHPTPVLVPGKSHGRRSLVGCSPWGRWESDTTERLHFHALEKEMATHSSVLAWRIPGTGEPGGLPSMGSNRVGHNWSNLAAAAAAWSIEGWCFLNWYLIHCFFFFFALFKMVGVKRFSGWALVMDWIMFSKSHVEVLTLGTPECDLIWK